MDNLETLEALGTHVTYLGTNVALKVSS